jgi:3-mercaptopyruvate sulfurtransferase SseA
MCDQLCLSICSQVLFSDLGWKYVDVRPALEFEEVGKVPGSINIPVVNSKRVFSPEENKKVWTRSAGVKTGESDTQTDGRQAWAS